MSFLHGASTPLSPDSLPSCALNLDHFPMACCTCCTLLLTANLRGRTRNGLQSSDRALLLHHFFHNLLFLLHSTVPSKRYQYVAKRVLIGRSEGYLPHSAESEDANLSIWPSTSLIFTHLEYGRSTLLNHWGEPAWPAGLFC